MKQNLRKRIGLDARFLLRPLRGIALYVYHLCLYLPRDRDLDFVFFINRGYEHNDVPAVWQKRIEHILSLHKNVRFVNFDSEGEIYWEQVALRRLVRQAGVDLIHMPANRVQFFSAIAQVVTLHDVMEYKYLLDQKYPVSRTANPSLRHWVYNARHRSYVTAEYKVGFQRADRIITVSNFSKQDILKTIPIKDPQVRSIYHGIEDVFFKGRPLSFEERRTTLMLGGDSLQKNPCLAIRAWSKVDPGIRARFPLAIIGFTGDDTSSLMNALKECGLEKKVHIHSWVSQSDLVDFFRQAAVFLFPSRYEGFGFPLIQAMACGTPVVTTNRASIPEVVGDAGHQCDADDPPAMAYAIGALLSRKDMWQDQSQRGLARARNFSWQRSALDHLDLYKELL